jgi:hypothetical protein
VSEGARRAPTRGESYGWLMFLCQGTGPGRNVWPPFAKRMPAALNRTRRPHPFFSSLLAEFLDTSRLGPTARIERARRHAPAPGFRYSLFR